MKLSEIMKYLLENYLTLDRKPLSNELAEKYSNEMMGVNRKREIDELVYFQEYYKKNFPIINKGW